MSSSAFTREQWNSMALSPVSRALVIRPLPTFNKQQKAGWAKLRTKAFQSRQWNASDGAHAATF
ncbi:hypothetical protein [Kocuria marina]|uniref:hypothetical protein n=1 Tax=Kocuria marina TaxID=223184 RepID=UPI0019D166A8|nr:hypothetical protein [Kocuria indica]MBN6812939.1 hypothetical protein [Kocuria indica]MBN6844664.1 hypothetical protein [Kocuria indica]